MMKIVIGFLTFIISVLLFVSLVATIYATALTGTVMNPSFIKQELDRTEAYSLIKDWLDENIEDFAPELGDVQVYQVIKDSLDEEWLADQVGGALDNVSAYLNGQTDTLEFSFSTTGFSEGMKTALHNAILESPPEGLSGLSEAQLDAYLEGAYEGIDQLLPEQITSAVENADKLEPVRDLVGAIRGAPSILLMLSGVFALLLIFLHFTVKGACRYLGIPLFITGVCCYVGGLVATSILSGRMGSLNLPSPLSAELVTQIMRDSISPANTYAIIIGVAGLVLIIASFFIKNKSVRQT